MIGEIGKSPFQGKGTWWVRYPPKTPSAVGFFASPAATDAPSVASVQHLGRLSPSENPPDTGWLVGWRILQHHPWSLPDYHPGHSFFSRGTSGSTEVTLPSWYHTTSLLVRSRCRSRHARTLSNFKHEPTTKQGIELHG